MGKATELKNTTDIVKELLATVPETRNSDDFLYFKVCEMINPISINLPFYRVILNRKEYKYPAFESVRRTRQKLQAEYPEFSGNDTVEGYRKAYEPVFKEYAKKIL